MKKKIQFQKGYSIFEFLQHYGTEEQCRKALESFRQPKGFECPECSRRNSCYVESRKPHQCTRCKYRTSVTNNTVFSVDEITLSKWFLVESEVEPI